MLRKVPRALWPDMADRWEDYFESGETLLWQGQPRPMRRPSIGAIFLAVFGIPFLVAGLFIFFTAIAGLAGADNGVGNWAMAGFMLVFSLPFIGAGAGMMFGPWYMQANAHRKVRYALSNKRAYIATQWWSKSLQSVLIDPDGTVTLENDRDVFFRTEIGQDGDGDKTTQRKGFENIADADEVYRLIRGIQSEAAGKDDD